MRLYLLLICLISFLSGCVDITLSVSEQLLPDQNLPYQTYAQVGNTCLTPDGGQATGLLRLVSNRPKDNYTSPLLVRHEVLVTKTTTAGQVLWMKQAWMGTGAANARPMIHPLQDGSFWVFMTHLKPAGTSASVLEPILIYLGATGEVIDQQILTETLPSGFLALGIVNFPGAGFVVKGLITGNATTSPLLIRFDDGGKRLWQRNYASIGVINQAYELAPTSDGGLILSSYGTNSVLATDGTVMRLNANGEPVWTRPYTSVRAVIIRESSDKGYILLGNASSPANALTMARLNQTGDVVWSQVFSSATNQYRQPLAVFVVNNAYGALSWEPATGSFDWLTLDQDGRQQTQQRMAGVSNWVIKSDPVRLSDGAFICTVSDGNTIQQLKITPGSGTDWATVLATNTN